MSCLQIVQGWTVPVQQRFDQRAERLIQHFLSPGNDTEIALLAEMALAIAIDKKNEDALAGKIAEVIYSRAC